MILTPGLKSLEEFHQSHRFHKKMEKYIEIQGRKIGQDFQAIYHCRNWNQS
jgi:hypothetical protein